MKMHDIKIYIPSLNLNNNRFMYLKYIKLIAIFFCS